MKILAVVFASIALSGFTTAPLRADVPGEIKPTIDPQLEALTAAQLVRLIKDMSTEEARNQLSLQLIYPEEVIDDIVQFRFHRGLRCTNSPHGRSARRGSRISRMGRETSHRSTGFTAAAVRTKPVGFENLPDVQYPR